MMDFPDSDARAAREPPEKALAYGYIVDTAPRDRRRSTSAMASIAARRSGLKGTSDRFAGIMPRPPLPEY